MSLTEISLNIPTEHVANVFGQFDAYIKKIERTLNVTVVVRGDSMKLIGNERQIKSASNVFMQLLELSKRGNVITEQNVNYALSLAAEAKESAIVEIDKDCICHTINGKPVKPKTLGQKNYVDATRQKMIVFGMGPAGTGKTYLAMAMAITAFKNEEVGRIILTRPAIEAGEKLGFLPGDLQSKVDPYLRPLYDALYQIMGAESFQKNMEKGLIEVKNPSQAMLNGRPTDASGSVVVCSIEGTRPILIEIQALVTRTNFGLPRRTSVGIDYNRVNLLMAVLEKRAGLHLGDCDAYVNLAGGMKLGEPAIDLGVVMAVVSSFENKVIDSGILIFGEVGLSGEVRGVSMAETRVREAEKLGFTTCIMPKANVESIQGTYQIQLLGVANIKEAMGYI